MSITGQIPDREHVHRGARGIITISPVSCREAGGEGGSQTDSLTERE